MATCWMPGIGGTSPVWAEAVERLVMNDAPVEATRMNDSVQSQAAVWCVPNRTHSASSIGGSANGRPAEVCRRFAHVSRPRADIRKPRSPLGLGFQGRGMFLTEDRTHRGASGGQVVMRKPSPSPAVQSLPFAGRHGAGLCAWRVVVTIDPDQRRTAPPGLA